MNSRLETREWPAERHAIRLDGDELLCRVPPTGIDRTMLDEIVHRQAETIGSRHEYQRERPPCPDFAAEDFLLRTVHRRFEMYAQLNPGAGAVKFGSTLLTYGELDAEADGLAVLLQQNGLGPGDFCAVCMTPSIAMVRAILAVLKAGGAYLLLDPMLPVKQIAVTLCAANPRIVIMRERFSDSLAATNAQIIFCGEDIADLPYAWPQEYPTQELSPAYAVSTFSAAASPRFVVNAHTTVIDRLASMQELSPIRQGDSVLQHTNYALNTFAWEFLWPLSHGAQLVIPLPSEERDPDCMRQLIARERITVMHVVPALLQLLLTDCYQHELRSLRALFCASDGQPTS